MIDPEDAVYLSDDSTGTTVTKLPDNNDRTRCVNGTAKELETIVIDDDYAAHNSLEIEHSNVIELTDTENSPKDEQDTDPDKIYRENKLLAELIEKCLDLENSQGMLRVINKTLLRVYKKADPNYLKSTEFEKVLNKSLNLLDTDPNRKFSHVKNLCETLKFHNAKKRVQLITLETNLKENKLKRKGNFGDKFVKRPKLHTVINLIDEDIIDLEDCGKENQISTQNIEENHRDNLENNHNVIEIHNSEDSCQDIEDNSHNVDGNSNNVGENSQNQFLVPQVEVYFEHSNTIVPIEKNIDMKITVVPVTFEPVISEIDAKIKVLEEQIKQCKAEIKILDEEEVDLDTPNSPYIRSEKLKSKIVTLYKKLCDLTGHEPVKQRKVRLQVHEGHPPGPVRRLEEFINVNIGSDGDPPFPDFRDVVRCVLEANEQDKLGWGKSQVMQEASSLFTQCGKALQKRRQEREWRDLLAMVKVEMARDPADEDPVLLAKLEANRRIGLHKEAALLERYTKMQRVPSQPLNQSVIVENVQVSNSNAIQINTEHNTDALNVDISDNKTYDVTDGRISLDVGNVLDNNCKMITMGNYHENRNVTESSSHNDNNIKDTANIEADSLIAPTVSNTTCNVIIKTDTVNKFKDATSTDTMTDKLSAVKLLQYKKPLEMKENTTCVIMKNDNLVTTTGLNVKVKGSICSKTNSLDTAVGSLIIDSSIFTKNNNVVNASNNINTAYVAESLTTEAENTNSLDTAVGSLTKDSSIHTNNNNVVNASENINTACVADNLITATKNHSEHKVSTNTEVINNDLQNDLTDDISAVKIKPEPVDIEALLDALGDNFTSTIIEIEDPFLVIEISSDSSDGEA